METEYSFIKLKFQLKDIDKRIFSGVNRLISDHSLCVYLFKLLFISEIEFFG